ncbi:MAG: hypothetical protein AAFY56_08720, partial [Pseudomonadota bacterium]
ILEQEHKRLDQRSLRTLWQPCKALESRAILTSSFVTIVVILPALFGLLALAELLPSLALVWLVPMLAAILVFLPALLALGHGLNAIRALVLLLFDNPLFCLGILAFAAVTFVLTLGLLPGPIGITLLGAHAADLRLKRYAPNWRHVRQPDWTAILEQEHKRLDQRSLRTLWQPWKA